MITIDTESETTNTILGTIACFIGIGASLLVDNLCNCIISQSNASGIQKFGMSVGKYGLDTVAMYNVSSKMYEELNEAVDKYNEFAEAVNEYNEKEIESVD